MHIIHLQVVTLDRSYNLDITIHCLLRVSVKHVHQLNHMHSKIAIPVFILVLCAVSTCYLYILFREL